MEGREGQRLGKCLGAAIFTCRPFHHSLRNGSCGKYGLLLLSARLICQTHNSINFLEPEMRKQTTPVQETIPGSILYISLPNSKCILYYRSLFLTIQQGIHSLRKYVLNVQYNVAVATLEGHPPTHATRETTYITSNRCNCYTLSNKGSGLGGKCPNLNLIPSFPSFISDTKEITWACARHSNNAPPPQTLVVVGE